MLRRAEISRIRSWPVLASGHSEKHAETRKKQAKIALRLRGPAAPLLRKVAFLMQNVANTPWYVPGVLHQNRGFLGVFLRKVHFGRFQEHGGRRKPSVPRGSKTTHPKSLLPVGFWGPRVSSNRIFLCGMRGTTTPLGSAGGRWRLSYEGRFGVSFWRLKVFGGRHVVWEP